MTVLDFIKTMSFDVATKCTFKVIGKHNWFFYFIHDDVEGFDWNKITYADLDKQYQKGIDWLINQGPGNYEIEQIYDLNDEPIEEGKESYIKYRFVIQCVNK